MDDPTADGIRYCLQDLVMLPVVTPFAKGFWTAALDVIQGSSPLAEGATWCLHVPPGEEVGWAWQHVLDRLDQEFYPMGFSFPQLGPCDLAIAILSMVVTLRILSGAAVCLLKT